MYICHARRLSQALPPEPLPSMEIEFEKQRRTILISGAGIAGLASALFISRTGYRVEVFEQAKILDPVGAGLQLTPNAMQVLHALELDRQVKAAAMAPPKISVRDAKSDSPIAEIRLGPEIVRKYGQPYLVIHRADLQNILLAACENEPDIHLRMGVKVRDAVLHDNGVTILADDKSGNQNYRGAALIGADGVHSVIRSQCMNGKPAKSTCTLALRALLRSDNLPANLQTDDISLWLGPEAHGVLYPIRGGHYSNFVLTVPEIFGDKFNSGKITGAAISMQLSHWNANIRGLLDINTQWTSWPIYTAPVLRYWHNNCIVLVGDAAHAMTPHAAQGAAMGLEDAAVLGSEMSKHDNLETAFSHYRKQRSPRTNHIRRLSSTNRMIYQLPSNLGKIRNTVMGLIGGDRILQRQDWIYRWKPPAPAIENSTRPLS